MNQSNPTLAALQATYTDTKADEDAIWTLYVLRPISFLVAWIFIRANISANTTTGLSMLFALIGGGLMATGMWLYMLAGAIAFNIFAVLDCADGTIARYHGLNDEFGAWLDAVGGYLTYTLILLCVPLGLARSELLILGLSGLGLTFLGGIGASANLLMRLEYQRVAWPRENKDLSQSIPKRVAKNLGLMGVLPPLLFIGVLTQTLIWIIIAYITFYIISWVLVTYLLFDQLKTNN